MKSSNTPPRCHNNLSNKCLATIFTAFIFLSNLNTDAQGMYCDEALSVQPDTCLLNKSLLTSAQQDAWYVFTATDSSMRFSIYAHQGHIHDLYLYGDSCANLHLLAQDSASSDTASTITMTNNGLSIGQKYYLKLGLRLTNCQVKCQSQVVEYDLCIINVAAGLNCTASYEPCNYFRNSDFELFQTGTSACTSSASLPCNNTTMSVNDMVCCWTSDYNTPDLRSVLNPNCTPNIPPIANSGNNFIHIAAGSGTYAESIRTRTNILSAGCTYQVSWYALKASGSESVNFGIKIINYGVFTALIPSAVATSYSPYSVSFVSPSNGILNIYMGPYGNNVFSTQNDIFLDDVTMEHIFTVNAAAYTHCDPQQPVQLEATVDCPNPPTMTYNWSPVSDLSDPTIPNPVFSPPGPGQYTYTVTATDPSGCQSVDNVVVTIGVQLSGPDAVCDISQTQLFTIDNYDPTFTYSWILNPSSTMNIVSGGGPNDSYANISFNNTSGGTIIVCGTNPTGCVFCDTIQLDPCCIPPQLPPSAIIINDQSLTQIANNYNLTSPYTINAAHPTVTVHGTFTVDQDLLITDGVNVYLDEDAKINVLPGVELQITKQCTLQACKDKMWDGIYILGNQATLDVNSLSLIRDAKNAVVSVDGGVYSLSEAILTLNYKHLVVTPYNGIHTGLVLHTKMSCPNSLLFPHTGERTLYGIEIIDVSGITIGNYGTPNTSNTIGDADYGIWARNSNLNVVNTNFIDLTNPTNNYVNPVGIGIDVAGSPWGQVVNFKSGGTVIQAKNAFTNCFMGIHAHDNVNVTVQKNEFDDISYSGISIFNEYKNKILINRNNKFNEYGIGIWCLNVPMCKITIKKNGLTRMGVLSTTNFFNEGILVQNVKASSSKLLIDNNHIIGRYATAIDVYNVWDGKIQNNTVLLLGMGNLIVSSFPGNVYGIATRGCQGAFITNNQVARLGGQQSMPNPGVAGKLSGIYCADGETTNIKENKTRRFYSGIECYGSMPSSNIWCNTLLQNYHGIELSPYAGADIGNQGATLTPSDNVWIGNIDLIGRINGNSVLPIISWYHRPSPGVYFLDVNNTTTQLINYYDATGSGCPTGPIGPFPGMPKSVKRQLLLQNIVLNQKQFVANIAEHKFLNRQFAYRYLKEDSLLMLGTPDDSLYNHFMDSVKVTSVGLLDSVRVLADSAQITGAIGMNIALPVPDVMSSNEQQLNDIYLNTWESGIDTLTVAQKLTLQSIACQEPVTGGHAVYGARVMLGWLGNCNSGNKTSAPVDEPMPGAADTGINKHKWFVGNIYPNPSDGDMQIDYIIDENARAELRIFTSNGKLCKTQTLDPNGNTLSFDMGNVSSGLYFYVVTIDCLMAQKGKISIIK